MRRMMIAPTLAMALSVSGCLQSIADNPKTAGGAVLGGVGGAVAGSQFGKGKGQLAMTAMGTLLGAWIGSEIGSSLDKADRMYAAQAESRAYNAPLGHSVRWNNPDSGHSGTYTPLRDGYDASGNYCRQFNTSVVIDGRSETATGTACRQPDGSWRMLP